jgi:hypothetical protein
VISQQPAGQLHAARNIGHRSDCSSPGSRGELGWAGCAPGSGGSNLAAALGSVAGDPDRHRGWLLCPSSVPAAAGRGLRPRVFSAHRPGPQLQVHAPAWAVTSHLLAQRLQTGPASLLQAIFTTWPGLVPIQTSRLALRRKSGPRIALPAHRLYYPVDIWPRSTARGLCGDLRGAP